MKKKSTSKLVRHSLGEDGSAPARRKLGEGGFFNLRVLIGLFVVLAGVLLALLGFGTFSNASAQPNVDPNGQGNRPNDGHTGGTQRPVAAASRPASGMAARTRGA